MSKPNPFFKNWTPEMVEAHNKRVAAATTTAVRIGQPKPVDFTPEGMLKKLAERQSGIGCDVPKAVKTFTIHTTPIPAPRMTRRDKWLKPRRACVQRYFDYRDELQKSVGDLPTVPDELHCKFYLPMPASWHEKRKTEMDGKPHKQRPDRDNMDKAVSDALFLEDGGVWKGSQEKYWCREGEERVELTMVWR